MTIGSGFYLMHRGWLEHPALSVPNDRFDRRSAWCWLVERAAFRPARVNVHGIVVQVDRGQFCTTISALGEAWNWPRPAVQRFLTRLRSDAMIHTSADTGRTVITICNYSNYQTAMQGGDTAPDTVPDTVGIQGRYSADTQKKEGKERKEKKEERDSPSLVHPSADFDDGEGAIPDPDQRELLANVTRFPDPVPEAVRLWNETAVALGLAQLQKLTPPRRSAIAARLKEAGGIEGWKAAMELVGASPFLLGQNDGGWKADIDFVLRPSKFTKIMEGGYARGTGTGRQDPDDICAQAFG